MRQWHQGKEGFMKVTRIQDKYNPDKVWMIKRYLCGTFYVNQEIKGQKFYDRDRRMTKRMLVKQAYSFGVEHTREFRVIWHEEHNLIFLDGTWSLDGSKIIDAWQKTEVL